MRVGIGRKLRISNNHLFLLHFYYLFNYFANECLEITSMAINCLDGYLFNLLTKPFNP